MSSEDRPKNEEKRGFGGLADMVSNVETPAAPAPANPPRATPTPPSSREAATTRGSEVAPAVPTPPSPYQPGQPSSSSSGRRWLIGIAVLLAIWWIVAQSTEKKPNPPRTPAASARPRPSAPPAPDRLDESKPPPGRDHILTTSQIQYCLAEDIRLGAAKSVVNAYVDAEVDRFNEMVNDYNVRCGEYRYREGTLESARSEVERHRSDLEHQGRSRFAGAASSGASGPGGDPFGWFAKGAIAHDPTDPLGWNQDETRGRGPEPDPLIQAIQSALNSVGYDAGPADGLMGNRTKVAILAFQRSAGIEPDGVASASLLRSLNEVPKQEATVPARRPTTQSVAGGARKPDLSAASSWEQAAIEKACESERLYLGPGDYYSCLRRELAELSRFSGKPDLSDLSSGERSAIEKACSSERLYLGPGDYYGCLAREVAELRAHSGKPSLAGISSWEREAVERACNSERLYLGPGDYYSCLRRELRELSMHAGKPDLSRATPREREAIERACNSERLYLGPGDYYSCLARELIEAGYR